jgi:uncharacterized C2H2 Zn-finger protein
MEGIEGPVDPNGGLIKCYKCGAILGRRKGIGKYSELNKQGASPTPIDIISDKIEFRCPHCQTGDIYLVIREGIGVKDKADVSIDK